MAKQEIIIDWLQFTIKEKTRFEVINEILRLDLKLFEELPKGKLGYKKQLFYNNISVLFDGNEDMGVHIVASGKGCRYFETEYSLLELINIINNVNGKITRIDLALDDRTGDLVPFEKMLNDIISGNITSKWKSSTEIIKRDMNGNTKGRTINVGSRTSDTFLRIYDKALEQNIEGIWNRIELEIKKANAEEIQRILKVDNAGLIFKGVLSNYMRLLIPNKKDSNKSRWKNRRYWDNLIDNVEKVKLTRKAEEKTIDEKKHWIDKQVGQTLGLIALADGDIDYIYNTVKRNATNLKLKNKKILEKYQIEGDAEDW